MGRIKDSFERAENQESKTLITYFVAGDNNLNFSKKVFLSLLSHADIIEIGVPFSDPMAEGSVIQRSHERALTSEITFKKILSLVKELRIHNQDKPIVLMGYMNNFLSQGESLFKKIKKAGVDGLIIVDLPYEESEFFYNKLKDVQDNVKYIKSKTKLPVVVGFGIKEGEIAQKMSKISDGVVIGSRLIDIVQQNNFRLNDSLKFLEKSLKTFKRDVRKK